MRVCANAELAVISRGVARLRAQGELKRVVGARITAAATTTEDGVETTREIGDGRGTSILPHRFNPGVGLSQAHFNLEKN
jgi:hypothetical protein